MKLKNSYVIGLLLLLGATVHHNVNGALHIKPFRQPSSQDSHAIFIKEPTQPIFYQSDKDSSEQASDWGSWLTAAPQRGLSALRSLTIDPFKRGVTSTQKSLQSGWHKTQSYIPLVNTINSQSEEIKLLQEENKSIKESIKKAINKKIFDDIIDKMKTITFQSFTATELETLLLLIVLKRIAENNPKLYSTEEYEANEVLTFKKILSGEIFE